MKKILFKFSVVCVIYRIIMTYFQFKLNKLAKLLYYYFILTFVYIDIIFIL